MRLRSAVRLAGSVSFEKDSEKEMTRGAICTVGPVLESKMFPAGSMVCSEQCIVSDGQTPKRRSHFQRRLDRIFPRDLEAARRMSQAERRKHQSRRGGGEQFDRGFPIDGRRGILLILAETAAFVLTPETIIARIVDLAIVRRQRRSSRPVHGTAHKNSSPASLNGPRYRPST